MATRTRVFERVGGHPALDFLNTVNDWSAAERVDYLAAPADAVGFGTQMGLLSRNEAGGVAARIDAAELRRLRAFREHAAQIIRCLSEGESLDESELAMIDAWRRDVAAATRTRLKAGRIEPQVDVADGRGATLRLRVLVLLLELLASERVARLKTCPRCGWFLLDMSKNGSRRWCSMEACGSREKAQRYYWRSRKVRRARAAPTTTTGRDRAG
jgi:predicted RNA-binding Zn ribbon-like protein